MVEEGNLSIIFAPSVFFLLSLKQEVHRTLQLTWSHQMSLTTPSEPPGLPQRIQWRSTVWSTWRRQVNPNRCHIYQYYCKYIDQSFKTSCWLACFDLSSILLAWPLVVWWSGGLTLGNLAMMVSWLICLFNMALLIHSGLANLKSTLARIL